MELENVTKTLGKILPYIKKKSPTKNGARKKAKI